MNKSEKAILSLLETHQPMMVNNLVLIVANETGNPQSTKEAYIRLLENGKIMRHPTGVITITK